LRVKLPEENDSSKHCPVSLHEKHTPATVQLFTYTAKYLAVLLYAAGASYESPISPPGFLWGNLTIETLVFRLR